MSLKIIPYAPQHADRFRDLNLEWVQRYFYVEPMDKTLLENCKAAILDKGGHIFMAALEDDLVGCFAFIKIKAREYELGKMAVDPKFQGHNIGQALMQFAIDFAHKNNWKKIGLYSNTKLITAIYIYRKYGFKEVPLEKNLPYARSNIKMELVLTS
jgi:GNAT superfamily N-acetyltransferase